MIEQYDGEHANEKLLNWIIDKIYNSKEFLEMDKEFFDDNFLFTYEFVRKNQYLTHMALKDVGIN